MNWMLIIFGVVLVSILIGYAIEDWIVTRRQIREMEQMQKDFEDEVRRDKQSSGNPPATEKRDMRDNWVYETKCRRCGEITEYVFGSKDKIKVNDFSDTMENRLSAHPRDYGCIKCGKMTVQDIVSYN